jgi:hypothetical protein
MVLNALLDPDDLVKLKDRDIEILTAAIRRQFLVNPTIHNELANSLGGFTKRLDVTVRKAG